MNEIVQELRKRIQGEVRFDSYSRALYSTDASIYELEPLGAVIPKSSEDIQATVELGHRHGVSITPRGGGTSLAGNAIGEGVVLDCSKYLNQILEVNREEGWARIQPGVVLDQLNQHLRPYGLLFAPDVATSNRANVCGMIGNNSSGAHSIVYGKTVDHLLELKVLLANGEEATLRSLTPQEWQDRLDKNGSLNQIYTAVDRIVRANRDEIDKRFPKILRRVAGYNLDEFVRRDHNNLAKLITGSEGTLAVISEAKVNLVPLKKHRGLAVVHFNDLFSALEAVGPVLEFEPCAVELIDENIINVTRDTMEYARRMTFVEGFPAALQIVEFHGDSHEEIVDKIDKLAAYLHKNKIGDHCYKAIDAEQQADVWTVRKAGLGLLMGTRENRKPIGFIEDSAVPVERLPQYIRRFDEIVRSFGTEAAYYAHSSVGCLHIRPKLDVKERNDVKVMGEMADAIGNLALEFGGTISGEHGDGLSRSCWNEKMFGPQLYQAFRDLKRAFDPKNILNPGKIVDAQFMTENLRSFSQTQTEAFSPFFDYSKERGLNVAIEMCNGNAVCRKLDSGTMCPSYMVTLEEEHSTRGRANALRAVLSGRLAMEEFTSRRMYEVMDLCIGCKGCKGECPTNVDMAKLKQEFLYHYNKANRVPLRDRFFGHIAVLNRFGSATAPLSNWVMNRVTIGWLLHQLAGIDCRRKLPPFARQPFHRWFWGRDKQSESRSKKKVVLFNDTFMNYNYPQVGVAAVRILEACGYDVLLPEKKCCGRPFLSKGMLESARSYAEFNVNQFYPLVKQGFAVVGCEPSCVLTFRDEYPDLLQDPRVQKVADSTYLIEEFLAREAEEKSLNLRFKTPESRLLLHGHCHSKAIVGMKPTVDMLKLLPQTEVEVVDSGCCGMAGSFGFEKEHYQISMAMGRRRLFPAVESKKEDWQVVAPGVSCRQQIEQGTGRKAKHPVEVLAENLITDS